MRYHRHSISTDATAETKSYEQSNLFPPHTPFKQLINRWNSHLKLNGHSQLKVLYQIHQNKSIACIPFLCMVFVKVISQSKFHRGSCGGSLFVNSPFYLSLVYVFSAPNPWRPTPILLNSIRFSITLLHQIKDTAQGVLCFGGDNAGQHTARFTAQGAQVCKANLMSRIKAFASIFCFHPYPLFTYRRVYFFEKSDIVRDRLVVIFSEINVKMPAVVYFNYCVRRAFYVL